MNLNSSHKRLTLKILLATGLLLLAIFIALHFFLDPFLEKRLVRAASEGSDGLYILEMKGLHCNPISGYAHIEGMWLHTDTVLLDQLRREHPEIPVSNIDLHIDRFEINGARFIHSYTSKKIDLGRITATNPDLRLVAYRDSVIAGDLEADSIEESFLERLPVLLSAHARSIEVERISFVNGKIYQETRLAGKTGVQQADSIHFELNHLFIPETGTVSPQKALYADHSSLEFKNYHSQNDRSPYAFAIGAGTWAGKEETMTLRSVSAGPVINDAAFVQQQKNIRRARFRVNVQSVQLQHLNFFEALHRNRWIMETLEIDRGDVDVLVDKSLEIVPDKRMPHEIIRSLEFYLKVDSVILKNLDIVFNEKKPESEGVITFLNTAAKIINLTNDTLLMTDATPARIYAYTRLMGDGQINLSVRYPLLSRDFACSFQATMDNMPLTQLNPLFEKDMLQIEDGRMEGVQLQANVRNGQATGTLEASYRNLKVIVQTAKEKKTRRFFTSLANVMLRDKNKPDEDPLTAKTGQIDYQRMPGDDFLRFLWRSARSGLLEILLPKGIKVPFPKDRPDL